jgi:hypothetical protein
VANDRNNGDLIDNCQARRARCAEDSKLNAFLIRPGRYGPAWLIDMAPCRSGWSPELALKAHWSRIGPEVIF